MIPVSYYAKDEFTSPKFAYAFAKGCRGTITDDLEYLHDGPVALFGTPPSWPLLRQAQAAGRDWYFGDHAYLGRGKYYRITKNAYQHDGRGNATSERFRAMRRQIQSWQPHGSHILICPNSAVYFSFHGINVQTWLDETEKTLRKYTDRPIRIRWKTQRAANPIGEDLRKAWAVVVYSSAAALEALIAGVPIFTLAPFAASVRMGLSDLSQIESPIRPGGRDGFLSNLCANQWTIAEMLQGQAWRDLQDQEQSRAA